MRNAKTSNIKIFFAAQALGAVYQQPIRVREPGGEDRDVT